MAIQKQKQTTHGGKTQNFTGANLKVRKVPTGNQTAKANAVKSGPQGK